MSAQPLQVSAQPLIEPAQPWIEPASAGSRGLPGSAAAEPAPVGLSALLAAVARRDPGRIVLADAADKPAWSGRPAMTWSAGTAAEIVARLARGLRRWRLPPASRIGLWFPGASEGLVAHLAVEAAGHVPCPMPPSWTEAQAAAGIEAAGLPAVLTQTRFGAARPAEALCRIAIGYFGLRYLAAFGPDVPDGVINLDALALDRGAGVEGPAAPGGLVSFAGGDPARPVQRSGEALLAAVAAHLAAARVAPGERILTLLPPSDLRGLVTGLGAALVSGAALETLPVFGRDALARALARPVPTHLVAPAFLEPALAGLPLPATLRTLVFAHRAPARLDRRRPASHEGPALVDVLALDEDAVLSGRRAGGDLALTLAEPGRLALPHALFGLRRDADGRLALGGQACAAAALQRGEGPAAPPEGFRPSRFRAALFAGTATAVAEA